MQQTQRLGIWVWDLDSGLDLAWIWGVMFEFGLDLIPRIWDLLWIW
jgi:hypothetical protein